MVMNTTAKQKKYFTPQSANQTLPLVKAIVKDIVTLYAEVRDRQERLDSLRKRPGFHQSDSESVYSEEVLQVEQELDKDIAQLQEYVKELGDLGVELKDPVVGLVDFPALIDHREVYLCWELGEKEIAFWHELNAGYQGRQSLLEDISFTTDADAEESAEE